MPLATIDIGTNTAQLLIVEIDDATVRRRYTEERFVRLGKGVDAHEQIGLAAQDRLVRTLQTYAEAAHTRGVNRIVAAGTSALRDASNRDAVLERVRSEIGLRIEILSGREEALWSFAAACAPFQNLTGSCLVVDIGGGSTELISGTGPARHHPNYPEAVTDRTSLKLGCVRLTERCFSAQPPAPPDVEHVDELIASTLDDAAINVGANPVLIGTAGTMTALVLVHAGPGSSWDTLEDVILSRRNVRHWRNQLLRSSIEEVRALHPVAMEGRADVFPVGVLLLDHIMSHFNLETVRVSPYELRHGLALRERAQNPGPSFSS